MGSYKTAMVASSIAETRTLDLQAETEQGDVSVGELTDLECGRQDENAEDCAPDTLTQRK